MKRALTYTARIIGLAIALVASSAQAQTTANGPYYANPAWDQSLPSNTRFIVLSNMNSEAVLDRETGLVWQRSPSPPSTHYGWASGQQQCREFTHIGNRLGWRMPTVEELASLVDTSVPPPVP